MDEEKDVGAPEEELQPPESSADAVDVIGEASEETPPDAIAENDAPESAGADNQDASAEAASEEGDAVETPPEGADAAEQEGDGKDMVEEDAEAAMLAMLGDLPSAEPSATPEDIDFGSAAVAGAEFQQLSEPVGQTPERSIDLLMDVNLPISIELGRTKMAISDILALGPGSVVELNKLAGEPVDLLVNYKIVARGEVVVIDENFGVRITQLLSAEERLRILGEQ